MGYEYLAVLLLTPANLREAIALAVLSWPYAYLYQVWALGPTLADTFGRARFLSLAFVFLPAAVLILRRPNDGPVPRWLERRRPTV
jgi:hypothetical protein